MNKIETEINTYVISLEQPFENWFGTLKEYSFISNKCIVENSKEENIECSMNYVYEADTNKPIKEFLLFYLKEKSLLDFLQKSNLSKDESLLFISLAKKIKPPKQEIDAFYKEMENSIPFEGGMGTTESIVGLIESL